MNTQNLDFSALVSGVLVSLMGLIPVSVELSGTVIYFMLHPELLWKWHGDVIFVGMALVIINTCALFGLAGYKMYQLSAKARSCTFFAPSRFLTSI